MSIVFEGANVASGQAVVVTNYERICKIIDRPSKMLGDYIQHKLISISRNKSFNLSYGRDSLTKETIISAYAFNTTLDELNSILPQFIEDLVTCRSCRKLDTYLCWDVGCTATVICVNCNFLSQTDLGDDLKYKVSPTINTLAGTIC